MHPRTVLPDLVDEVSRKIGYAPAGEDAPRPTPRYLAAALRYMQRPRFVRSVAYRDLRWRTSYGDCDGDIRRFGVQLYKEAEAHLIPIRVWVYDRSVRSCAFACEWNRRMVSPIDLDHGPAVHGRLVMVEHATLGLDLPPLCWDVLRRIAEQAACRLEARLLVTGYGIEHPWMLALAPSNRALQPDAAVDEFKRLERKWMGDFRRGVIAP